MLEREEAERVLQEIAHSRSKSLEDLLRQTKRDQSSTIAEKAREHTRRRLEERSRKLEELQEELKQREEELSLEAMDSILEGASVEEVAKKLSGDRLRQELNQSISSLKWQPEDISSEDIERSLKEYIEQGLIELEKDRIKITPKGARRLARHVLQKILENLTKKELGPHAVDDPGFGVSLSLSSRRYEPGDEYALVDIQRTLLNSLERNPFIRGRISIEVEDFQIFETVHESRMCAGLIIDESGSMTGEKINAAVDTSLALYELIRKEPKDLLKVFLFSREVKEIPYWDILNFGFDGGTTDIRAALRAFRRAVRGESGDKQAYLITDTEPNTEDGMYVGFERAAAGVLEEALHYRQEGITLNIIMLDENQRLKQFASLLAQKNAGRVFFTDPKRLGGVVIEDYLHARRGSYR